MAREVSVYVANLGKYNEGYLVGDWITLPVTPAELSKFLREKVEIDGKRYEEYAIHDYDGYPLNNKELFGEYTRLEDLNLLAAQMSTMKEDELNIVDCWLDKESTLSMDECMNILLQVEDIPYFSYDYPVYRGNDPVYQAISDSRSEEFKMGYTLIENDPELKNALETIKLPYGLGVLDSLVDYKDLGQAISQSGYVTLYEDGYIDDGMDGPDLNYYTHNEIVDEVISNLVESNLELAESFEAEQEKIRINQLERKMKEGAAFYNEYDEKLVVAHLDAQGKLDGFSVYKMTRPEAIEIANNGLNLSEIATTRYQESEIIGKGTQEYQELATPMSAESGYGWMYDKPEVVQGFYQSARSLWSTPNGTVPGTSSAATTERNLGENIADATKKAMSQSQTQAIERGNQAR